VNFWARWKFRISEWREFSCRLTLREWRRIVMIESLIRSSELARRTASPQEWWIAMEDRPWLVKYAMRALPWTANRLLPVSSAVTVTFNLYVILLTLLFTCCHWCPRFTICQSSWHFSFFPLFARNNYCSLFLNKIRSNEGYIFAYSETHGSWNFLKFFLRNICLLI